MIVSQKHPYYKEAERLAPKAEDFAIDLLRRQIEAWARKQLLAQTFIKEGLQARFISSSLERILQEPHSEKYFQLLALLDFERLLKQAAFYKKTKGWRYFQVEIHETPSLISIQEEAQDNATIYNLAEKKDSR